MKRKLLCLLLALCLFAAVPAGALAADNDGEMLEVLSALGVMNGDERGELNLEQNVTRAQFAKMAVAASRLGTAGSAAVSPFNDVASGHWAAGYLAAAAEYGWLNGYPDGSFRPEEAVTLAQAVTVLEKLLGYKDGDFTSGWPEGQMALGEKLGLTAGVQRGSGETLTRLDCARLVYNTLNAQDKYGKTYAQALGHSLDESGKIDRAALVESVTKGPITADSDWLSDVAFTPLHIYRNGEKASISAVREFDVLYYSETMKTVWATSRSVTGKLTAVLPNAASPDSITVDGVNYALGSSSAGYAVSELGDIKPGDMVTLLLGRDDIAAAVMPAGEPESAVVGLVTSVGMETAVSESGDRYTRGYVTLTATDGKTEKFTFPSAPGVQTGDVVLVSSENGVNSLARMPAGGLSGTVSENGGQIGSVKLAADAEILDVSGTSGRSISPARLAGVTLNEEDVLACVYNDGGEAAKLVLGDVTGDVHSYGLLREKTYGGSAVYYKYLSGGVSFIYPAAKDLGGAPGGIQIKGGVSAPEAVQSLLRSNVTGMDTGSVTTEMGAFTLNSTVQIYVLSNDGESMVSSTEVDMENYTLTAWYDDLPSQGGALRVITAEAK
ncbi:MAG: S-layer homology domain-containing protein [Candidatus Heteroscillospira sp.]|jgi:hypothetical protein